MNRILTSILASAVLFSVPALVRADNLNNTTEVKTKTTTDKKEKKDGSSEIITEVNTQTHAKAPGTDGKGTRNVKTKVKKNADGTSQTTIETKTKTDDKH